MPACDILVPTVVNFLIPGIRGALEIAALVTPAIMCVLRLIIGRRHIASNHSSAVVQGIQRCVLYFGILVLGFLDGVVILSHVRPPGSIKSGDYFVFAILIFIYLAAMTVAMYPGRVDAQGEGTLR